MDNKLPVRGREDLLALLRDEQEKSQTHRRAVYRADIAVYGPFYW